MNSKIRAFALAVPTIAVLGFGSTGAYAIDVQPLDFGIAQPEVTPEPQPQGPGDIALPEPGDTPDGPDDFEQPEAGDTPEGPDDLVQPEPGDGPDLDHCDGLPTDPDYPQECLDEWGPEAGGSDFDKPKRIDAGEADRGAKGADADRTLALMLGGGALLAAGGAFAARRMARN